MGGHSSSLLVPKVYGSNAYILALHNSIEIGSTHQVKQGINPFFLQGPSNKIITAYFHHLKYLLKIGLNLVNEG
jgi:hypothetical protein